MILGQSPLGWEMLIVLAGSFCRRGQTVRGVARACGQRAVLALLPLSGESALPWQAGMVVNSTGSQFSGQNPGSASSCVTGVFHNHSEPQFPDGDNNTDLTVLWD